MSRQYCPSKKSMHTCLFHGVRTTKVIATSCAAATTINSGDKIFHPTSLVPLPPAKITTYATSTASSKITLKFIKNPVLLHMLQKERLSP